jgi:hypothetical protein
MSTEHEDPEVARSFGGAVVPVILGVIALAYLGAVWSEARKPGTSAKWLPAPLAYFTQIAALFPGASRHAIDYRVEGWRCRDKQWVEIDHRAWFPIEADNKESRFYRAMHFYADGRAHRQTLQALDEFIVDHHNADTIDLRAQGKGGDEIGGVRFVKLTTPFGNPGDGSPRYERKPLTSFAEDQRKDMYYTPESKREKRCAQIGR